jgi:hypothetical protein
VRLIVLVAGLGAAVLALGLGAPPAAAAKPCWKQVIDDWQSDGRIDGVYSQACLREALHRVPQDVREYSSFEDKIRDARQQQVRTTQVRRRTGAGEGNPTRPGDRSGSVRRLSIKPDSKIADPPRGLFSTALNKYGPQNSDSLPLPLLILAGLALLLMAAGAAGLVSRRLQSRRAPVPPAP